MREKEFIRQNKEKWEDFEQLMESPGQNPEKLSQLFIQITDDLSYARSYYPTRAVRLYLNQAAQRIYSKIFKNKRMQLRGFARFWISDIPVVFWEARKSLLVSAACFIISFFIGVLSTHMDPEFASFILGPDYIRETFENIRQGEPTAIYKSSDEWPMFIRIAFNNMMVAFLTFVTGALSSIGSMGILLRNGVMVGTFQYFFYQQGLLIDSALVIWLHGTIEISSIILAGAAGIELGKGLLFPGTHSRKRAFQWSARRGSLMMLGIFPFILLAAFIESFVTRYAEMPDIMKLGIIILSALIVFGYFIWLPYRKFSKGHRFQFLERRLPAEPELKLNLHAVKDAGTLIQDALRWTISKLGSLALGALVPAVLCAVAINMNQRENVYHLIISTSKGMHDDLWLTFLNEKWIVKGAVLFGFIWSSLVWLRAFNRHFKEEPMKNSLAALSIIHLPLFLFIVNSGWMFFAFLFILPVFGYYFGKMGFRHDDTDQGPFDYFGTNLGSLLGCALIVYLLILFTNSAFLELIIETLSVNSSVDAGSFNYSKIIFSTVFGMVIYLGWQLILTLLAFQFFSNEEKANAVRLTEKIERLFKGGNSR